MKSMSPKLGELHLLAVIKTKYYMNIRLNFKVRHYCNIWIYLRKLSVIILFKGVTGYFVSVAKSARPISTQKMATLGTARMCIFSKTAQKALFSSFIQNFKCRFYIFREMAHGALSRKMPKKIEALSESKSLITVSNITHIVNHPFFQSVDECSLNMLFTHKR